VVDFTRFMAQKDQKNKLKQVYMEIIVEFFRNNSREKV
jgi:hypothetical protein